MTDLMPSRRHFLQGLGAGGVLAGLPVVPRALAASPAIPAPLAALRPQTNDCRSVMDLSGLWRFRLDPDGRGEGQGWQHGFAAHEPDVRQIAVPGSWNEQFEDTRDYCGLGWYATEFSIPRLPAGQRFVLRVGSAVYAATVWIDGARIGMHTGGHLPFDYDVTAMVRPGATHRLVILVDARLLPDRVPQGGEAALGRAGTLPDVPYDFFPYSGLHRAVTLASLPPAHLTAIRTETTLQGADAVLSVAADASGWSDTGKGTGTGRGTARLLRPDGQAAAPPVVLRFVNGTARASIRVPQARLWSPADPALHRLEVVLDGPDGAAADRYTLTLGLRTVAVSGARLLLNGQPVRLRGAARHEDFPVNGRGLNLPVAVRDTALLRWIGGNSFRTTHYPYAEETLDLADAQGLLVIAEIPAVDLSFADSEAAVAARLAQCKADLDALIARDRHRPSIVMWNIANEPQDDFAAARSGLAIPPHNDAAARGLAFFQALFAHARARDSSRPLTLVGMDHSDPSWVGLGEVLSLNRYPGWYDHPGDIAAGVAALADELDAIHARTGKAIMLTEFGADAVPGQHDEPPALWSEEYQANLIEAVLKMTANRPWIVGAHVWCLCDFRTAQAVRRPDSLNLKGVFTRARDPKLAAHRLRHLWGG